MATLDAIDSNKTSLRIAEEDSLKTLPGSPVWKPYEPNSYDNNFGAEITTVARSPITESRQNKKGVVVDLDSAAGFNTDLLADNLEDILQGFFFADLRPKGEETVTAVDVDTTNPDEYEVADTDGFLVGSLIQGQNFTNAANNTVNVVTVVTTNVSVEVADGTLADEASPPSDAQIVVVGHQGATGDLEIDASGDLPQLISTTLDLTTLGLIPGEWIFIGGDTSSTKFFNAENNGWARVKSVDTNAIVLDKTDSTMVTDDGTDNGSGGTGLTINLYFGRVLKNESDGSLITRRTYQIERQLGAPDTASPSDIQAEYITGAVPNQITFNFQQADKITADLTFVAMDHETLDAATSLKSGTRPSLSENDDVFNTTNDFSRLRMQIVNATDSNPTTLFAYLTEFQVTINNNVTANKAISVLGAFDASAGNFVVDGSAEAYFADVAAIDSIRSNSDVTLDFALVKNNNGILVDIPLISLGDGRADVQQDEKIKLPLTHSAAADPTFDHTLLMMFYDYLPDAADTA